MASPASRSTDPPSSEEEDVVTRASLLARAVRQEATEEFRQALLVAESAVQASRMLLNMAKILEANSSSDERVEEDKSLVEAYDRRLQCALDEKDAASILDVEAQIERMTLRRDPMYLEREDERRKQRLLRIEERNAGWMSTPSNKFIQLMKGDTKGEVVVTREERRSCMSKAAWTCALAGMAVAIAFLVVDFYTAQKYPVLRTDVVPEEVIPLPVMTFCMGYPNIGSFYNRSRPEVIGDALFGITEFHNRETNVSLTQGDAYESHFESLVLGPDDCQKSMQQFGTKNMILETAKGSEKNPEAESECFACFQSRRDSLIRLQASKAGEVGMPPIQVEFARSKTLDFCFKGRFHYYDSTVRNAIVDVLILHAKQLEERGVLKADTIDVGYGLESLKERAPRTASSEVVAEIVQETVDILCNVYFFSGYFYPVEEKIDIQYLFFDDIGEGVQRRHWKRSGAGPYHTVEYFNAVVPSNYTMVQELTEKASTAFKSGSRLDVYAQDASTNKLPSLDDRAVTLTDRRSKVLHFRRHIDNGIAMYETKVSEGTRIALFDAATFARYTVELGFTTFESYVSTRRPTTSLSEFLTDIFEYVGLFTGVCAYSVLVAPARIYLRRGQSKAPSRQRR